MLTSKIVAEKDRTIDDLKRRLDRAYFDPDVQRRVIELAKNDPDLRRLMGEVCTIDDLSDERQEKLRVQRARVAEAERANLQRETITKRVMAMLADFALGAVAKPRDMIAAGEAYLRCQPGTAFR